jgi:hypothetical protein
MTVSFETKTSSLSLLCGVYGRIQSQFTPTRYNKLNDTDFAVCKCSNVLILILEDNVNLPRPIFDVYLLSSVSGLFAHIPVRTSPVRTRSVRPGVYTGYMQGCGGVGVGTGVVFSVL